MLVYDRTPTGESVIADAVRRDRFFALGAMIIALAGLVAVLVSYTERTEGHIAEYYCLLAAAAGGMIFLVQANTLMTLFLGLEWFSISLYILCAIDAEQGALARGGPEVPGRSAGSARPCSSSARRSSTGRPVS